MAAAATAVARGYGRSPSSTWRTTRACACRCVIGRPRPASGTLRWAKLISNLPVKVRSGQSRAGRPGASLAGVAVTRGLKRRQRVDGVCGSNPESCLSWRPSWHVPQRRQHGRHRDARGRSLHRGLRAGHVHTVDIGTQEVRRGPLAGHRREHQGREDRRLVSHPWRTSHWPVVSTKSPKATR